MVAAQIGAVTSLLLGGCVGLLPEGQMLVHPVEQSYRVRLPVDAAWRKVCTEAEASGGKILVRDDNSRLLSWIAPVSDDAEEVEASLMDPELFDHAGTVVALTTIRAVGASAGCRLFIRRVYIPKRSHTGISHSRGIFERALVAQLEGSDR